MPSSSKCVRVFAVICLIVLTAALVLLSPCYGQNGASQQIPPILRDQAIQILKDAHDTVKKDYYDAKFHGVDIDARRQEAEKRIRDSKSLNDALGIIAWYLDNLNDSHTFFIPPMRPYDVQNGWEMGFIGDACFITAVQPGSDAAGQGVKPGDRVLAIEGFAPTRDTFWKINYAFNALAPRAGMHLVLLSPGQQQPRQLEVKATVAKLQQRISLVENPNAVWDIIRKYQNLEQESRVRHAEVGDIDMEKIPAFDFNQEEVDRILNRARDHRAVVLDLRGNPGGDVETLSRITGGFFDHDVKIGDPVARKERKPQMAKSHGDHAFKGKVVVLIDSSSASAAELLARVMQLEKRGTVMGDRSSGKVMEAKTAFFNAGVSGDYTYGLEVTVADMIMSDGKSLEHVGVTPDELVLPTPEDMAANRDPVLAKAVESLGGKLALDEAGKIFPVVWHKPNTY